MIISAQTQLVISVNYGSVSLLNDRDFLFKPLQNSSLDLYFYLVNNSLTSVLTRNNSDKEVTLPRHSHLGAISEMKYNNCFCAESEHGNLAMTEVSKTK